MIYNTCALVVIHEKGAAQPGTKLFMGLVQFQEAPGNGLRIVCMNLGNSNREVLAANSYGLNATIRLITDLEVTEHNAASTPWFGGLFGSYKWSMDKAHFIVPVAVVR